MPDDLDTLLGSIPLVVRRGPYALGSWRHEESAAIHSGMARIDGALGFVLWDDAELSVLLPESLLDEMPPAQQLQRDFAAITLDTALAWDVVGVLAKVSGVLAAAGIPIGVGTAFARDHLLVPAARLDEALAALAPHFGNVEHRAGS